MKQRDEAVRKETEVKALLGQITFELNEAKAGNTKLFGDLKRTEAKLMQMQITKIAKSLWR